MKKILVMIIAAMMILGFCIPCLAEDNDYWDRWNSLDASLLVLRIADWAQTRYRTQYNEDRPGEDPETYYYREINPLLGRFPSMKRVNQYFATCIICDYLVSRYAPKSIHKIWLCLGIPAEVDCVGSNIQLGVKMKF